MCPFRYVDFFLTDRTVNSPFSVRFKIDLQDFADLSPKCTCNLHVIIS
jgi:hypothetical protein